MPLKLTVPTPALKVPLSCQLPDTFKVLFATPFIDKVPVDAIVIFFAVIVLPEFKVKLAPEFTVIFCAEPGTPTIGC